MCESARRAHGGEGRAGGVQHFQLRYQVADEVLRESSFGGAVSAVPCLLQARRAKLRLADRSIVEVPVEGKHEKRNEEEFGGEDEEEGERDAESEEDEEAEVGGVEEAEIGEITSVC